MFLWKNFMFILNIYLYFVKNNKIGGKKGKKCVNKIHSLQNYSFSLTNWVFWKACIIRVCNEQNCFRVNFASLLGDVCSPKFVNKQTSLRVCSPIFWQSLFAKSNFGGFTSSLHVLSCDEIAYPVQMKRTFRLR